MLKRTLTAEEHAALTPTLQPLYVAAADGNGFALEIEADPAVRTLQTSIGEFRENNITLQRQMEELRAQRQPPPENAALEERVADLTRIVTEEREATLPRAVRPCRGSIQDQGCRDRSQERGTPGSNERHGVSRESLGLPCRERTGRLPRSVATTRSCPGGIPRCA